jgi:RNase H
MKPSTGHYIFNAFHHSMMELCKKHIGIRVKIKWVPGHKSVEGNEMADKQVKKVITEGSSAMDELPKFHRNRLPYIKSALIQAFGEKLKERAQKAWEASKQYGRMKKTDPTTLSNKYLKLITPLPRKLARIPS